MVPLRFVAEALDAQVSWDPKTRTVQILSTTFEQFVYTQNIWESGSSLFLLPAHYKSSNEE